MDELGKFLRTHSRKPEESVKIKPKTHTKYFTPTACYSIPTKDVGTFMTLYCNASGRKNVLLGITELPPENNVTPLRVDFDFRLDPAHYSISKSPITHDMILKVIEYYQIIIEEICDHSVDVATAQSCILLIKKGSYRLENGVLKEGFHLHFPHMHVNARNQDGLIRKRILEILAETCLFNDLKWIPSHSKTSPLETIVDKIATKPWLMYNSRKNREVFPYLIEGCYDGGQQSMELSEIFDCEMDGVKTIISYNLPRLFSIRNNNPETSLKARYTIQNLNRLRSACKTHLQRRNPEDVMADLYIIREAGLLDMLDVRRAEDRDLWIDVGWSLFCIGDGSEKALDMWIEFSKKCPEKFDEEGCIRQWRGMTHKGKTMWSLMKIAQEDNPEEYRQWRESEEQTIVETILQAPKVTDYAVAKLMQKMFEGQFLCSNHKADEWYEFHSHRWHELDGAVPIRTKLLKDVADKFRNKLAGMGWVEDDDTEQADRTKKARRKLWGVIERIENTGGQDSILKMAKTLFHDPKFLEKKDQADYLFVFENGVYDLDAGIFRNGRPDDFMTLSCDHYLREFDPRDIEVQEVEIFWRKIFPSSELYEYFMDLAASNMKAGNRHKLCPVFTGAHDGGKSVSVDFICRTFGEYAYIFPREYLMLKAHISNSGGARADIYQSQGKRWAFCPELAENEELNVGLLKATTGSDSTWCRTLHQKKGLSVKPKYCLTLQCNDPPKIPASDDAAFRRLRLLDFQSRFYEDRSSVPKTWEEQLRQKKFHADTEIRSNGCLDDMCEPWLWMLIQRFKKYKTRGSKLSTPAEVTASTDSYRKDNDIYLQFISETFIKTTSVEDKLLLSIAYSEFTAWYSENYPDYFRRDKIGKINLRKNLAKHIGNFCRKGVSIWWDGWKMRGEENDDENDPEFEVPV